MLREKVVEVLRNLPKPLRRNLTPAPQFADAALRTISGRGQGALFGVLAETLNGMTGIEITAAMLEAAPLPDHLRFRIVLTGEGDLVKAVGRDLASLQEQFGQKARRRFMDRQGSDWNRDGETGWVFEALPASVRTEAGNQAFPALIDQQQTVGLRLFDTAGDAAYAHLEGVRRLLSIGLKDKLHYLEKHHGIAQQALLVWSVFGTNAVLIGDLAWSCLCAVVDRRAAGVRDVSSFEQLLSEARSAIGAEFQRRARQLESVLVSTGEVMRIMNGGLEQRRPEVFDDISSQLQDLVYEGFLRDLEPGRLQHYPRYLEAMHFRLQRQELDPARDAELMARVNVHWTRYLELIQSGVEYDEALDQYRWLVEEYRVSIFAQKLGTAEKTSTKRLSESWRKVMESV
jgi:ATP-dependent helicase HrpA